MKQNQITLIIIGFILVALMATNPSTEEHKEAVKEKISAAIENKYYNDALIDKMIKRENYLLFSITKYKNEKVVGYGFFGKIYLSDDISENISEKIEESSNPIIGKPIKIENIEVAEKDFPNTMNWEDAKKACENLGRGWRLPTKDELNTLYINKDKIGGFAYGYCWSSTEYNSGRAWAQDFSNGKQYYYYKYYLCNVRAVRAF